MQPRQNARVYDQGGMWGQNIVIHSHDNPEKWRVSGHWTPRPIDGDLFHVNMQSGKVLELVFTNVEPTVDPPDMFFADAIPLRYVD
jgi:hypothetical protein